MGRPRKQTADWFPHYVSDSRTKFVLEDGWGNDGYAFWFKLLELLSRSDGHYYDCSSAADRRYLVALMKIEETTIDAILALLADMGKIDGQLWREHHIIWCQALVDNLSTMYAKRTTAAPKKPFSEEFSERKPDVEADSDAGNTHSTEQDSTGEDRRVENTSSGGAGAVPGKPPRRRKPSSLSKTQEARFNRFWAAYPRPQKVGDAEKAWAKINPDDALTEAIIAGVKACIHKDYRFREERFTPLPATWLNAMEWKNQYGGDTNGGKQDGPAGGFRPSEGFKREE